MNAFALLALCACTPDVRGLYDAARVDALALATERLPAWEPDLVIRIAGPDLEKAVGVAIRAAVSDPNPLRVALPLGLAAEIRPKMAVERASLRGSDACPSCLRFDAELTGKAIWTIGPASGSVPFDVGAEGVFAVEVTPEREVRARPRSVGSVRVKVGDLGGLRVNPSGEIQGWLRNALADDLPVIRIVDLGDIDLPVRDLRLRTSADGQGAVAIELLSNVPGALAVVDEDPLAEGVRVSISETALVGLARRAAFEKGELTLAVAADPRALAVDGGRFTLSLRLWRLVGRGWWRDYEIEGDLGVEGGKLVLTPLTVLEVGSSPGAELVDPLAAIFQGRVLEAISDAFARSLPASRAEDLGTVRLRAAAKRVRGHDASLSVEGSLDVQPPR